MVKKILGYFRMPLLYRKKRNEMQAQGGAQEGKGYSAQTQKEI